MRKTMTKLLRTASKTQSCRASKSFKAAGLILQMNRIFKALKARKLTGTTKETVRFAKLVKGSQS